METVSASLAFERGIHRSSVNSPLKGQWRGALMFSLICAWINAWVNNREAGDLRRRRTHHDVIVMMRDVDCNYAYTSCEIIFRWISRGIWMIRQYWFRWWVDVTKPLPEPMLTQIYVALALRLQGCQLYTRHDSNGRQMLNKKTMKQSMRYIKLYRWLHSKHTIYKPVLN